MPSDEKVLRKQIALAHIIADMRFAARAARDIAAEPKRLAAVSNASLSFTSFMVYEAVQYIRQSAPEFADVASVVSLETLKASRHSAKLFDDDDLGFVGVTALFEDGFMEADRKRFIESIRLPFLRRFGRDLGLTFRDKELIYTTHAVQYNLGLSPGAAHARAAKRQMLEFGRQCGAFVAAIDDAAGPSPVGQSYASRVGTADLVYRDVIAAPFYRDLADASFPNGVSASLAALCGTLNTLNSIVGHDTSEYNGPTATKLHFVTVWHATRALEEIRTRFSASLSSRSLNALADALDLGAASEIMNYAEPRLRNALVHYGLSKHYPIQALKLDAPLFGLVKTVHPRLNFASFQEIVYSQSRKLAATMNGWLAVPTDIGRRA